MAKTTKKRRGTKVAATCGAIAACGSASILALTYLNGAGPHGEKQPATPRVEFVKPSRGAGVPLVTLGPSGTLSGLARDRAIYLVNRKSDESRYHPQDVPCERPGGVEWTCPDLYLGRGKTKDVGARFELLLVAVDDATNQAWRRRGALPYEDPEKYVGLDMPDGAEVLGSISVARKRG